MGTLRDIHNDYLLEGYRLMQSAHVVIAYGNPKIAAMVQALASVIGGPGAICRAAKDDTSVVVEIESEEQAEEFRRDLRSLIPTLASVSPV
jgi:hypothetical protein